MSVGPDEKLSEKGSSPEPKILGFLCTWCSYAGADLAGVSRYQYPNNIRIVRIMCSARIDPVHIIEVLKEGIDGVLIGGCHLGDCHYITGNYHTLNKFALAKMLIEKAGMEPGRLRLDWVSASEGVRFAEIISEFTDEILALGTNPVRTNEGLKTRMQAAVDTASDQRIRTIVGREHMMVEVANVYGEKVPREEIDTIIAEAADSEFHRRLIIRRILTEPKSVRQIAAEIDVPPDKVLRHVISLRAENKVGDAGHEGMSPLYIALRTE